MRVTIIRETNTVAVGGVAFEVDCSALPADVHAIQWDGESGEVEYSTTRCPHCSARSKKGNAVFTDFSEYQPYVTAWEQAMKLQQEKDAEAARVAAEAKAAHEALKAPNAVPGP